MATQPITSTALAGLPRDVRSAINGYQPRVLNESLAAAFLDPIRLLVAGVPPRDVGDARQMLSAATRFVRETAPPVTADIVDVFDTTVITRWEHASLAEGGPVDRVRLYASWLHRLRRVAIGCAGRVQQPSRPRSSRALYTCEDLERIVTVLPAALRAPFVAFVGAGVTPEVFGAGRFEHDGHHMVAVTGDGVRRRVVDVCTHLVDLSLTSSPVSWRQLRCGASDVGVDIEFHRCADTFVALVATSERARDALTMFGVARTRLERVVTGLSGEPDNEMRRVLRASGFRAVEVTMDGFIGDARKEAHMPRPSRKSVRDLAASYANGGLTGLDPARTRRVDGYRPQGVDDDVWVAIRDTHRAAMQRCGSLSDSGFSQTMSIVTSFLVWRHSRQLDVTLSEAFTQNAIDTFCEHGLDGKEPSTRNTYRTRLTPIAVALDPNAIARPAYSTRGHQPIKPCYTAAEERAIRRAVVAHPDGVTGRKLAAVVALAAGAGLDTTDMRYLERGHIHIETTGITIDVPGNRPRLTVVRSVYDDMLIAGIEGLSPNQMVFGTKANRRNVLGNVFANAVVFDDTPPIDVSRLRATWLAAHMQAAVPIQIILTAAGLKSARALVDLLPYLPDDESSTSILRGVA